MKIFHKDLDEYKKCPEIKEDEIPEETAKETAEKQYTLEDAERALTQGKTSVLKAKMLRTDNVPEMIDYLRQAKQALDDKDYEKSYLTSNEAIELAEAEINIAKASGKTPTL